MKQLAEEISKNQQNRKNAISIVDEMNSDRKRRAAVLQEEKEREISELRQTIHSSIAGEECRRDAQQARFQEAVVSQQSCLDRFLNTTCKAQAERAIREER